MVRMAASENDREATRNQVLALKASEALLSKELRRITNTQQAAQSKKEQDNEIQQKDKPPGRCKSPDLVFDTIDVIVTQNTISPDHIVKETAINPQHPDATPSVKDGAKGIDDKICNFPSCDKPRWAPYDFCGNTHAMMAGAKAIDDSHRGKGIEKTHTWTARPGPVHPSYIHSLLQKVMMWNRLGMMTWGKRD
jgi:hypothetical protein